LERQAWDECCIDPRGPLDFRRSPDQLGPEHIRKYQAMLFTKMKFSPNSFLEGIVREKALYYSCRRDLRMAGREEREKAEI
jgi:hypothetical protein